MRFEYGVLAPLISIKKRGLGKQELLHFAEEDCRVSLWSKDMLNHREFVPSEICDRIEFAVMTPRLFGYERFSDRPSMQELLNSTRLEAWSRKHLHLQSVGLCEQDDAFYIREAYRHRLNDEVLAIGMKPQVIHEGVDQKGVPWKAVGVYYVDCVGGTRFLHARYAMPESTCDLDDKWLFQLMPRRALRL